MPREESESEVEERREGGSEVEERREGGSEVEERREGGSVTCIQNWLVTQAITSAILADSPFFQYTAFRFI